MAIAVLNSFSLISRTAHFMVQIGYFFFRFIPFALSGIGHLFKGSCLVLGLVRLLILFSVSVLRKSLYLVLVFHFCVLTVSSYHVSFSLFSVTLKFRAFFAVRFSKCLSNPFPFLLQYHLFHTIYFCFFIITFRHLFTNTYFRVYFH